MIGSLFDSSLVFSFGDSSNIKGSTFSKFILSMLFSIIASNESVSSLLGEKEWISSNPEKLEDEIFFWSCLPNYKKENSETYLWILTLI